MSLGGISSSTLLNFYQVQLSSSASAIAAANAVSAQQTSTQSNSATANDVPPWDVPTPTSTAEQAQVLSTTNFLDTSNVPLTPGATSSSKTEQDNQNLFSLYSAVNTLSQLAQMAQSSTATSGQLAGYNTRFQEGLSQIQSYLGSTTFNDFNLEAATPSNKVTSTANVPISSLNYSTKQLVTNSQVNNAMPG